MSQTSLARRLGDRVYRALLGLLPADDRRLFGADMALLFADHRRELTGQPRALAFLWMAGIWDVLQQAWRGRRSGGSHERVHMSPSPSPAQRPHGRSGGAANSSIVGAFLQDVRFGLRLLIRQPGFTCIAALILTLGIGANTAAFSVVNALLLQPRSGGVDSRLVGVFARNRTQPETYRSFSWQEYEQLGQQTRSFLSMTAHGFGLSGLREGDAARRVFTDIVTGNYFETFGVRPMLGRTFTAEEERPGAGIPVVIVGHELWRRMGQPADILDRTLEINARQFSVVGVAPKGFGGTMVMVSPELYVPTGMFEAMSYDVVNEGGAARLSDPSFHSLIIIGLLQPGVSVDQASARLSQLDESFGALDPSGKRDYSLELAPLSRMSVSDRPQVDDELTGLSMALLSLAAVVMLIASFNLANMLLARGRSREKEFAIRLAIGGSRWRLVRQLLTESLVLAAVGAAGGLVFSWWTTGLLVRALPAELPLAFVLDTRPDLRVLAFTTALAMVSTVVFGLGPAWRLARTNVVPELKEQAGERQRKPRSRWWSSRDLLVTGQLALTFVMLTVAGLFVGGALDAAKADPGFTLDRGIVANMDASLANFSVGRSRAMSRRALETLRAIPGVTRVGFASHMPFGDFQQTELVQRAGPVVPRDAPDFAALTMGPTFAAIGGDYFDALGVPLRDGRMFTEAEVFNPDAEPVAIIDQTVADRLFEGAALGEYIQLRPETPGETPRRLRVVGIAGPVRESLFDEGPGPFLYVPYASAYRAGLYFHVQTRADSADAEAAMLPTVRRAILDADPDAAILTVETRPMFRERNLLLAIVRAGASVFGAFGLAALFLAVVGVYGVKAYMVSQRTREIGVRMALGARPGDVIRMVLRDGAVLVTVGLAAGTALSVLTGSALRGMLFQGKAVDVPVVVMAAMVLVVSILLASWVPARRATRIAPTIALRSQ